MIPVLVLTFIYFGLALLFSKSVKNPAQSKVLFKSLSIDYVVYVSGSALFEYFSSKGYLGLPFGFPPHELQAERMWGWAFLGIYFGLVIMLFKFLTRKLKQPHEPPANP